MSDFFTDNQKRPDFKKNLRTSLLACTSGRKLNISSSYYDHRHMFRVRTRNADNAASFIASPFLSAQWQSKSLANGAVDKMGTFTSGISRAVALKLLRTSLHAGSFCTWLSHVRCFGHCYFLLVFIIYAE